MAIHALATLETTLGGNLITGLYHQSGWLGAWVAPELIPGKCLQFFSTLNPDNSAMGAVKYMYSCYPELYQQSGWLGAWLAPEELMPVKWVQSQHLETPDNSAMGAVKSTCTLGAVNAIVPAVRLTGSMASSWTTPVKSCSSVTVPLNPTIVLGCSQVKSTYSLSAANA